MEEVSFDVKGSAAEPYKVRFIRKSPTSMSAFCSCPAGQKGQYCKHRFGILDGMTKGITSSNQSDVDVVRSWLPGTKIEVALVRMRELQSEFDILKEELSLAKKDVAKAMRN
ncbi:MAG: hypothetical protein EP322_00260 [Bacteroidetes bacterium]|nr:MAG: hypothetical protein EP322_00260 [Bacteroidota bacterium]